MKENQPDRANQDERHTQDYSTSNKYPTRSRQLALLGLISDCGYSSNTSRRNGCHEHTLNARYMASILLRLAGGSSMAAPVTHPCVRAETASQARSRSRLPDSPSLTAGPSLGRLSAE